MRQVVVIALLAVLSACGGNSDVVSNKPKPRVTVRPKTETCKQVADNLMLRFYYSNGNEFMRQSDVFECVGIKDNNRFVRFSYKNGAWNTVNIDDHDVKTWPDDGTIPDYWNSNINCQIQQCSKTEAE